MRILKSCIIAFSMYTKVPMPKVQWTEENMRYVMCFFPFVGVLIGAVFYLWCCVGLRLPMNKILYTAILLFIPILITGGIHIDGFLDTVDALSSYQSKERRLEILKDSHAGAFAVIAGFLYFFAYFGFLSEVREDMFLVLCFTFSLSRILSAFSVTTFPCAKNSGIAYMFSNEGDKEKTFWILMVEAVIVVSLMITVHPLYGCFTVLSGLLLFIYYYHMSIKKFGGITGDLAGWFLQMCELIMLIVVIIISMFINMKGA